MHHEAFGEIEYKSSEEAWIGRIHLPVFAEYGRLPPDNHLLQEPEPGFNEGFFGLLVHDMTGQGPSEAQANAVQDLKDREHEVCHAVMAEVIEACNQRGAWMAWLQERRQSRLWGWLAAIIGPEYKAPEDLKLAARVTSLEIARDYVADCAYIGFHIITIWATEMEHGFMVVYHPQRGTFSGTTEAIFSIDDAENVDVTS